MSILLAVLLATSLILNSCTDDSFHSIDRENLFRLDIGRLEDQIDLFGIEDTRRANKTRLVMKEGLFYISDGNGAKLVRYTSYGDLLSMIYNPENNPPPFSLKTDTESEEIVTRRAIQYPFNGPGELAVDSHKHLYVEDRLPQERRNYDPESRSLLDSTVLHFDGDGRFIEYLGQEGIGGTPFPRINGIYISLNDEVAIITRYTSGWSIYWFDADGNALFLIDIKNEDLPIPQERKSRPSLETIIAAPDSRNLYMKIDYYRDTYDESTNTKSGIAYDGSTLWIMNIENGNYEKSLEIPVFETTREENNEKTQIELIYSCIGVAEHGRIFFSVPDTGGYSLLMLEKDSTDQKRGFIRVDDDELTFNAFHLSSNGILSALLATEWEAKVVWWRTDRLFGELGK